MYEGAITNTHFATYQIINGFHQCTVDNYYLLIEVSFIAEEFDRSFTSRAVLPYLVNVFNNILRIQKNKREVEE